MAPRAQDGEKVVSHLIDEKKLVTILKRFLGTKESDPEVTKYCRIENGLHYMATTLGSAAYLLFNNKYDGTFTKGTGESFYRKLLPKDQHEDHQFIPEIEVIQDGKKKIKRPTGNALDFPNIPEMFNKFNLDEFYSWEIPVEDLDQFIAIHEAMDKASKVGGTYKTAKLELTQEDIRVSLHDSPLTFQWTYKIDQPNEIDIEPYHYDFALMTDVVKSIKDLKVKSVGMYIKSLDDPIIFVGHTTEYEFKFAINRKLVK